MEINVDKVGQHQSWVMLKVWPDKLNRSLGAPLLIFPCFAHTLLARCQWRFAHSRLRSRHQRQPACRQRMRSQRDGILSDGDTSLMVICSRRRGGCVARRYIQGLMLHFATALICCQHIAAPGDCIYSGQGGQQTGAVWINRWNEAVAQSGLVKQCQIVLSIALIPQY